MDAPADFTATPHLAYRSVGTGWTSIPVVPTGDGGFVLDVPPGDTWAIVVGVSALVSTSRSVDLGHYQLGRVDVVPQDGGAVSATMTASGLAPLADSDAFLVFSAGAGEVGFLSPDQPLPAGSTSTTNESFSYLSLYSNTLDGAKGDTAIVTQMVTRDPADGGPPYASLERVLQTGPLSVGPGIIASVTGTFVPPSRRAATIDLRGSAFAAQATAVHPQAAVADLYAEISTTPAPADKSWQVLPVHRMSLADPTQDVTSAFTYGIVAPGWTELINWGAVFAVPVQLPGTSQASSVFGVSSVAGPATTLITQPLTPGLSPARAFQVDGQDAQQNRALSSTSPLLTWLPPATGTATGYAVRVRELSISSTNRTQSRLVARVMTAGTSLRLPPGILQSGRTYVFILTAESFDAPKSYQSAPFYAPTNGALADVVSAQLTAP